jgi:Tol biopolymer transport system component
VWHPDKQQIAFVRQYQGKREICIVPALGGPVQPLATIGPGSGRLDWSPDGNWLAYSEHSASQQRNGLFLLSIETRQKHPLTAPKGLRGFGVVGDHAPKFDPDGQTLAFIRQPDVVEADIYLLTVVGGEPRGEPSRLTFDNRPISSLAWTADGREIVFSSSRSGSQSLWRVPKTGGEPQPVAGTGQNISSLSISRRGQRLAYAHGVEDANFWRIELPSTSAKGVAATPLISSTQWDGQPQFSPEGKRIVFRSNRSGSPEIWVCESDGSGPRQVTSIRGAFVGSPRWSHDGRHIAFDSSREGRWNIYVIQADGGPPRRITSGKSNHVRPSWSRNGRWIYFGSDQSGEDQIWKAASEGEELVQVTKKGGHEAFESPDGQWVYYHKGRRVPQIWKVSVDGGEETLVLDQVQLGHWAVAKTGIYFMKPPPVARPALELYRFESGEVSQVVALEKDARPGGGPSLTVSPDERWLLRVQEDRSGSDIMLVENFR